MNDEILEAFDFGKIQECRNIKLKLDEHGISWEEFLHWVQATEKRLNPNPRKVPRVPAPLLKRACPGCNKAWLQLNEVNHHPRYMVGDGLKCQWSCLNCGWEEYSEKDIKDEAAQYIDMGVE